MLGAILQRARQRRQLSQETVALRAKLTREYISLVERDAHSPTVDALLRICHAIGVNASYIISKIEKRRKSAFKKR